MEQVGYIDRDYAVKLGLDRHGFFLPDDDETLHRIEYGMRFGDRDPIELDKSKKQVIPYCVIRHTNTVLAVSRLTGGKEKRLHHKVSIGIGGHINPIDGWPAGSVMRAMEREIAEELVLNGHRYMARLVGFINDDTSEVSSVHLAAVFSVEIASTAGVHIAEKEQMTGEFVSWPDVDDRYDDLEGWSRHLVDARRSGILR